MRGRSGEIDFLKRVPLFEGLTGKELKLVREGAQEERFAAGKNIITEGSSGGRFYVILEGQAKILLGSRTLKKLGPGDFFGEMSLFDNEPRSATVQAVSPVRTLSIARWNFLVILEENWKLTAKILGMLSRRVRSLEKTPL